MNRRNIRRLGVLIVALPVAVSLSACSIGLTEPGSDVTDKAASTTQQEPVSASNDTTDEKADAASMQMSGPTEKERDAAPKNITQDLDVIASQQGLTAGGGEVRIDVNSLIVKDGVTTLTLTATILSKNSLGWMWAGNGPSLLQEKTKLFDPKSRLAYSPGMSDSGDCLCTTKVTAREPGESQSAYASFQELPAGVDKVNVIIDGFLPFEDIPVIRK